MSQEPWHESEPSPSLPGGLPLTPKEGGYTLQDILALHDRSQEPPPAPRAPETDQAQPETAASPEIVVEWAMPETAASQEPIPLGERAAPPPQPAAPDAPITVPVPERAAPPWGALPLPTLELGRPAPAPAETGPSSRLPMIDPAAFAAMPIDSLTEPADDESETAIADPAPLARLQRSLATLNELEAQLDQLMSEAGANTVPDASEWLGALADSRQAPEPMPSVDVAPAWPAELAETVEAASQRPTEPISGEIADEPLVVPVAPQAELTGTADGLVDVTTPDGLAAAQQELTAVLEETGRLLDARRRHQQAQAEVETLMAKVQSGALGVDEVIAVGQALAEARQRLQQTEVDPAWTTDLIARLQWDRGLLDQCIARLSES